MVQFAQAVPAAAGVLGDLIAQNMDWPGADVISERLKKIVPPNILTAEEREKMQEDMPEQQEPTPEQQIQMKELEVRSLEAEAKSVAAQATNEKSAATIAKAQADLVQSQLDTAEAQAQLQSIQNGQGEAYQQVRELVAEALAELMANNQNVKA